MTSLKEKILSIDGLNIGLILLSFLVAIKIPFTLFLFAYAVLGPLHYLTEMAWLKEKYFFSNHKFVPYVLVGLSGIITIVFLLTHYATELNPNIKQIVAYSFPGIVMLALILGGISSSKMSNRTVLVVSLITVVAAVLFAKSRLYYVIFGGFLATIIHVFIFTGAFMLYGAKKSKSFVGFASVLLLLICGILIFLIPIDPSNYSFSKELKESFTGSKFTSLHFLLSELFYGIDRTNFSLVNEIGIKVQAFIAFAYTYHYLNWFSKTSIIGWHKVSTNWLVVCGIIWIASVSLYYINYEWGLSTLFFLSILHVFLEFPLNALSFKGIFSRTD